MEITAKPASAQERTLRGEVTGVQARFSAAESPKSYRVQIDVGNGNEASLYVTMAEAPPLWAAYELVLRPAGDAS